MFLLSLSNKKKNSEKIVPIKFSPTNVTTNKNNYNNDDVEAQNSSVLPQTANLNNKIRNHSININKAMFIYGFVAIVTVCALLVPIFTEVQGVKNVSRHGIFGEVVQTSIRLMIMESISIGCTLPMLSDVFLDQVTETKAKMSLSMWHRGLFLLVFSTFGVLYLSLSDYSFMAYLYIVFNRIKVIFVGAVTSYTVSSGTVMQPLRFKIIFLVPVIMCANRFVFDAYSLVYPDLLFLENLSAIFYYLMFISFFGVQITWYFLLWCRYRVNKTLNNEEKKEAVYMLSMLFFIVTSALVNAILGWNVTWLDTGESILVGYIVIQIICILLATVLPARFMRKVIQMSEAILQLKREFVRYVSHEIRSPLNVVHAGLELLRADLVAAGALTSTLVLLQDIFFASSAAIEILNDMLQYEHIDSGTFKLDCAVVPMPQAFAGRMDSFKFMLANKNITLHIEDLAQVSEFYSPTTEERQQSRRDLLAASVPVSSSFLLLPLSSSPSLSPSSLVLFIDRFRVEQIIRNLMTNAAKFTPEGGNVTIRFLDCLEDLQQQQAQHLETLSPETVAGFSAETLAVTKRFLRIEVQDSGVGIAIEDQPQMFKQFTQFNRNALQGGGGSGLGLWICKNLVTFHGGRLGFRSEGTGKGSTFFVDLPIFLAADNSTLQHDSVPAAEPSAANCQSLPSDISSRLVGDDDRKRAVTYLSRRSFINPNASFSSAILDESVNQERTVPSSPAAAAAVSPAAATANRGRTRILIVDDSSINRKMIRRMLEAPLNATALGDVIVEEADDGATALKALKNAAVAQRLSEDNGDRCYVEEVVGEGLEAVENEEKSSDAGFDLVFIDYIMTAMNGPEAVQIMRRDMRFTGGIIGVTGNALPADLTYFKECGADLVITKPLTNKKLMDAIHSVKKNKSLT